MRRVGILGLPQSGKTTLFEILLQGAGVATPAGGREHVGVVHVPDPRVASLSALYQPKKTTFAQVQFVDSAAAGHGSARAAAKGPDLFASVRNCDAFVAVVRAFENPAVPAEGGTNPVRDLRALESELILNDLMIVEGRLERIAKELRIGKKQNAREHALLERVKGMLESERPLRAETFDAEEEKLLRGFQLLSMKPLLALFNLGDQAQDPPLPAAGPGTMALGLRAHLEREIVALPPGEREAFRAELGMREDGLTLVIRACYALLGLIAFFTVGPDEVRAWTIRRGDTAVAAAGEIHTDLARGFIRAETIAWERLLEAGGTAKAREKGWLRLEGREYVVQDGDCLEIRFNK
jgi:ribosome-binding ATPase